MNRSKVIAIITGAIAIAISIAYLLIVQILDFRSEMVPAPIGWVAPTDLSIRLLQNPWNLEDSGDLKSLVSVGLR